MTQSSMIQKVNKLRNRGGLAMLWELDRLTKEEDDQVLKEKQRKLRNKNKETGGV